MTAREAWGISGACLLSLLVVVAAQRGWSGEHAYGRTQRAFYALTVLALAGELPNWISFANSDSADSGDSRSKAEYALYLLAEAGAAGALSAAVVLSRRAVLRRWRQPADSGSDLPQTLLLALNAWFTGMSAVAVARLAGHSGTVKEWVDDDPLFKALVLGNAIGLLVVSLAAVLWGVVLLRQRLRPTSPLRVVVREVNTCFLICSGCLLLRTAFVASALVSVDAEVDLAAKVRCWGWVGAHWGAWPTDAG